jgi:hypothetical protein
MGLLLEEGKVALDESSRTLRKQDRQLRCLKWTLQGAIMGYVVLYAVFYKNTHLRMHPVTGNVYVNAWPNEAAKRIDTFWQLPYCFSAADPALRCSYINEIDLFSFDDGTFIPTRIQVLQQRASCMDGTNDTDNCVLDFKTSPHQMFPLDRFLVGQVENYRLQFTHAFQSEGMGSGTMADVEHRGLPDCDGNQDKELFVPLCYNRKDGGHDLSSVQGLLNHLGLSLDSNNDETNHAAQKETYRTSGMKLSVHVHYNNMKSWWIFGGQREVGYDYRVEAVPSPSVWRSRTLWSRREMRAWLREDQLKYLGKHDRVLIWADGIEVKAKVRGTLGHLDLGALLLLSASAVPLLLLAEAMMALVTRWCNANGKEKYEEVLFEDAEDRCKSPAISRCRLNAGELPQAGSEGNDGL